MDNPGFVQISDVERETGLGNDLLRKWRSRYGFPNPSQGGTNVVGYTREQISQLRLIKRLLDCGFRPAQIVGKELSDLEHLIRAFANDGIDAHWGRLTTDVLDILQLNDIEALDSHLERELAQKELTAFVRETAAPLVLALGEAWARGKIEVHQEHLCTAVLMRLLYSKIASIKPKSECPRILLATPPDELHALGLLMTQAVLAENGAHCINLGQQMPIPELRLAALAYRADVVAMSFSAAYPMRRVEPFLMQLRKALPSSVEIWAGGSGTNHIKSPVTGLRIFSDLYLPLEALTEFPQTTTSRPSSECS